MVLPAWRTSVLLASLSLLLLLVAASNGAKSKTFFSNNDVPQYELTGSSSSLPAGSHRVQRDTKSKTRKGASKWRDTKSSASRDLSLPYEAEEILEVDSSGIPDRPYEMPGLGPFKGGQGNGRRKKLHQYAVCNPPCQNMGICLAPNKCNCPPNWQGRSCEVPKGLPSKSCANKNPAPKNSRIQCSRSECRAECYDGYHFAEGTTTLTYKCQDGNWVIPDPAWTDSMPNCLPICDPPCMNEGKCIVPNVCQCTPEYRGDICRYHISTCDPKNLKFNGNFNCSGEGMMFGCVLTCPLEVEFTFPATSFYSCDYSTGVWSPSPVPLCDYSFLAVNTTVRETNVTIITGTTTQKRRQGLCFTWAGTHYKSFDNNIYSFESSCSFTLLQDSTHGTFTVNLHNADGCKGQMCQKVIQIFLEDDEYILQATESGRPSLSNRNTNLAIPGQINGIFVQRVAHFVVIKLWGLGLTLKWDMKNLVEAEVSEVLWNRTSGLCGRLDGNMDNDWSYPDGTLETNMNSFLQVWQAKTLGDVCLEQPKMKHPCTAQARDANEFCSRLQYDLKFVFCRQVVDVEPYINACRWDYCDCDSQDREACACESFAAFYRECANVGGDIPGGWRSQDLCPVECRGGKVYNPCMSTIQPRCGLPSDGGPPDFCVEGCDCPRGLVHHQGNCIPVSDCPCTHHKREYNAGDTISHGCNSCTCLEGEWVCTEVKCGSRCAAVGDPHYTTFDGRRFDFMGKCSYYLVQGQDFSIEVENQPCAGAFSENMNFQGSVVSQYPSCTKSVTVRTEGTVIHLKQGKEVTVNGVELMRMPAWVTGAYIKIASSILVIVELSNGMDVWWDGQTRVYVDAPAKFRGETAGLCGTFTDNQRDDFLTPEGDIEQDVVAFANKWKTSENCPDQPLEPETRPCERHVQNKEKAEKYCAKLKSHVFSECHLAVDPEPYYQDCLYDLCSCETNIDECFCPVVSAFGKECARKGTIIDWRTDIRECEIQCTNGQEYQVCGNSCSRTCQDLTTNTDCIKKCVEGCNCPFGFTLDSDDICLPINECPCVHDGEEYEPGHKMRQQQVDGAFLMCECNNAAWQCRKPQSNETMTEAPVPKCQEDHEVYSDCVPQEQHTCQTMHLKVIADETCRPGCTCAADYVRDSTSGVCVLHKDCPCHHGGRSYNEKDSITEDCNTCVCKSGMWLCTKKQCPGICTAWGDSHYKTFDGRLYEFQGDCDYLLAKGKTSDVDNFEVVIQNVPCGTSGVTCAKSITLRVGKGDAQEIIEFSQNKPTPFRNMTRTIIREAGVFVFAEVTDIGLVLQWDRGTRAYLRLDPLWQGKVRGLCGNYNGDEQDDFQTPSGGSSEALVNIFGDSWRLQNSCPDSVSIKDSCSLHPYRKVWATEQCAILKTEIFAPCHSEVPVKPYEERCLFDACACDTGGDCHCLCTAVAAYAHECNIHGVYIKWRTPDVCPMQCDETCEHYEACVPTCPLLTCDTLFSPKSPMCTQDACVEGCSKDECPPGQVYKSSTELRCVPKSQCEMKCMVIDGKLYKEGDIISQDECHRCFCSHEKKVCRGTPCTTTVTESFPIITPPIITPTVGLDCRSGWTEWISEDQPIASRKNSDKERVPEKINEGTDDKGFCMRAQIVDMSCRSVGTHRPHTEQQNVKCSLEEGLMCQGRDDATGANACWDYEVSFLCDCNAVFTTVTTPVLVSVSTSPIPENFTTIPPIVPVKPPSCEEEPGWSPWYNMHTPNADGEFEFVTEIRKSYSLCPDHYITEVECRPVMGGEMESFIFCDKKGARCRNNAGRQYCQDYEVRVFCHCECQDGLGMEDFSITNGKITASSSLGPADKPYAARLNFNWAWTAQTVDEDEAQKEWLQVDLGEIKEVTGVVTQGHPMLPRYVEKFAVHISDTGEDFKSIKDRFSPLTKEFTGNTDGTTPVANLFPEPVFARYVRIIPIHFNVAISLRVELKGCDIIGTTTPSSPVVVTTSTTESTSGPPQCVNGWTPWMNTYTPNPANWDDMDDLRSLAEKYTFCASHQIMDTQCRVVGVGLTPEASGQVGVTCNTNTGLQCNDDLQAPQHCYDYEIRFYCDCNQTPTPITTHPTVLPPESCSFMSPQFKQHEYDCKKFYECKIAPTQMAYVVRDCGSGELFNTNTLSCDSENIVIAQRPECRVCPDGTKFERKAIRCDRICVYYRSTFTQKGICLYDGEYAPGCVDKDSGIVCPGNRYLRDKTTCVSIQDCNCRFPDGTPGPPGQVFKVSECEVCQCDNNNLVCDSSACATTTTTITPSFECNKWSSWLSESAPMNGNEWELLDHYRNKYPEMCSQPENIECRVKGSHESPEAAEQVFMCNTQKGLECLHSKNPSGCLDYEVRFFCGCEGTPTQFPETTTQQQMIPPIAECIPPKKYKTCAVPCDRICNYHLSVLHSIGECMNGDNCAYGCVDNLDDITCPYGQFMINDTHCVPEAECTCRQDDAGPAIMPGVSYNLPSCKRCTCQDNSISCVLLEQCLSTPVPTETSTTELCDDWTPYVSSTNEDEDGFMLTVDQILKQNKLSCEHPANASCREVFSQLPATDLQQNIICDAIHGLKCLTVDNVAGCFNYEISFYCACEEVTTVSHTITFGPTSTLTPCDAWSPWINDNNPIHFTGDLEYRNHRMLRETIDFCLEGEITDIECVEADTGLKTAADKGTICDVTSGFYCDNAIQDKGICHDYKIRYYCSCEPTISTTTIVTEIVTTPLLPCDPDMFLHLLEDVEDEAFSSTPARNALYGPSSARLYHKDGSLNSRSWAPLYSNEDQFIQVDLGSVEPVYGVEVAGNPLTKDRVTAFTVEISRDSRLWSVLPRDPTNPAGQPKIFRGAVTASEPVIQIFTKPVETRYVRLKPTDWYQAIALRFEVIGCGGVTIPSTSTVKPECEEQMGLENEEMSDHQIIVSSVLNNQEHFYGKKNIRLNSPSIPRESAGAWVAEPKTDQFVRFDFLEPSKLSGLILQGRSNKDEWVETFTVRYSPDGQTWSTVKNPDGSDKVFPGNYDRSTTTETKFERLIQARFLEIRPKTWKSNIAMRVEVLGCFHPYHEIETTTPLEITTQPTPPRCSPCPSLPHYYYSTCIPCSSGRYFDGHTCVEKILCPCFDDAVRYDPGAVFESFDCEVCSCLVGGDIKCAKKECPPCEDDQQAIVAAQCACLCKPCPDGTKLCPSSNYCLNESSWCNGIEECPDDELNCITTTPVTTTAPPCPVPTCPPDYVITLLPQKVGDVCPSYECIPSVTSTTTTKPECPRICPKGYIVQDAVNIEEEFPDGTCSPYECIPTEPPPCSQPKCADQFEIFKLTSHPGACPRYACVPILQPCPPVECPEGMFIEYITDSESAPCPRYKCTSCPPVERPRCQMGEESYRTNPNDSCPVYDCRPFTSTSTSKPDSEGKIPQNCKVDGSTISSFDGSSFEVEICNHILAEDMTNKNWIVAVHHNCTGKETCSRYVTITQNSVQLILQRDRHVIWKDSIYTVTQAQRIGNSTNAFKIYSLGNDTIVFKSTIYNFVVKWNVETDINIVVYSDLIGKVDGLCGFYSEDPSDDKRKPNGAMAMSYTELAQSWALNNNTCEKKCTSEVSKKAHELCRAIQSKPFTKCHSTVDPAPFMKGCVDTMCECLSGDTHQEECRCQAFTHYVTRCLEKNPEAPIADWRIVAKCYKECGPGEVYQDCFRAECEDSCESLHDKNGCPEKINSCVSGCFCIPGLLRKGESCVRPELCRDCVCEAYGDPHYTTFDRYKYTFNGECSYIAVQDKNRAGHHKFQVISHSKKCTTEPVTMCIDSITILYNSHSVIISAYGKDTVRVSVDGSEVTSFPHQTPSLEVERPDSSQVMAAIHEIQMEVNYHLENFGFSIRLPSHLYFNKTEGLCGNCNYNKDDDTVAKNIGLVESVETFGRSWLLKNEPSSCGVLKKEKNLCLPLPPDEDPCLHIMDQELFGKCHPVEDPVPYVSSCQLDICNSTEPKIAACHSLEAYARRCADLDICLDWRSEELCPKKCTGGQEYRVCVSGCVHTCENYEELEKKPDACPVSTVDGCFCPEDMVLYEGTCVDKSYCHVCDDEGHRVGDTWQADACTTCNCTENGNLCMEQKCLRPLTCDAGFQLTEIPGTEDGCCGPQFKCKEIPKENCTTPVEPQGDCGYGQIWKLIEALGKCPQYACVCLESEECPQLVKPRDEDLKPGEEWTVEDSGCCAKYIKRCTGKCHEVMCPEFQDVSKDQLQKDECCPQIKCVPPSDACIYDHQYLVDDKGYQQPAETSLVSQKKLYKIGEQWEDGLCLTCKCSVDIDGLPHYQCTKQTCPTLDSHPDQGEYELENVETPGQCCPQIIRTACIDGYEAIQIGETLDDPLNECRSVRCVKTPDDKVEKREEIQTCVKSCSAGWKYEPPLLEAKKCCGECVQVACVVESQVKAVGETWVSDDLCTTYTCARDKHDQIQIQAVEEQCTEPNEEDLQHYVYDKEPPVPGQCCPVYTRVACLMNDNQSRIEIGVTVQDPNDSCLSISCVSSAEGNITRREREITCDVLCDRGSSYSQPVSDECCGKCIPTHCVDDDVAYSIGQHWESEENVCFEYSCELRSGVPTTVATRKECPYFDPECPDEAIYMDEFGCCKGCNTTTGKCKPEVIPLEETVGLFEISLPRRGTCRNTNTVPNFKRCSGYCDSFTVFQKQGQQQKHVSTCFCCKPSKSDKMEVELLCDTGETYISHYDNIVECQCLECSDNPQEYEPSKRIKQ